jgi:ribose/xylose/arabinose/galactoside ABC-type transport system permease subunit
MSKEGRNKNNIFRNLDDEKKERILRGVNDQLIWLILVLFFIAISIITPRFTSQLNITNILRHSAVLGLLVIGEVHLLLQGKVDLSIESTLGFTAMLGGVLMWDYDFNPILTMVIMLFAGALIGLANSIMVLKLKIDSFVVTLGMLIVFRGFSLVISGGVTRYNFPPVFRLFAAHSKDGLFSVPVAIMIGMFLIFHVILSKRVFGRQLYAVGGNPDAAYAAGIDVNKVVVRSYITSGILAALGGIVLAARLNSVPTTLGEGMVFEVFAAAVIGGVSMQGGRGNLIGALGGALLLSSINSALTLTRVPTFWVETSKGLILLFAVFLDTLKVRIVPILRRKWLSTSMLYVSDTDE